jgi:hypothetical protein
VSGGEPAPHVPAPHESDLFIPGKFWIGLGMVPVEIDRAGVLGCAGG